MSFSTESPTTATARRLAIQVAINSVYREMLGAVDAGADPLTALGDVHARHFAIYQAHAAALPALEAAVERALRRHNRILTSLLAARTALHDQQHYAAGLWRELQAARAADLPGLPFVAHMAAWRWECAAREWVRLRGRERTLMAREEEWEGKVERRKGRWERRMARAEVQRRVCRSLRRRLREVSGEGVRRGGLGESSAGSSEESSEEESEEEEEEEDGEAGEEAGEGAA